MEDTITEVVPSHGFLAEFEEASAEKVSACFYCQKCSSGCPVTFAMDIVPHRVIHMIQMGLKEPLLRSSTIWVCASCETCTTRCPNDIDVAKVMDGLRQMALQADAAEKEKNIRIFHSSFLSSIKRMGRLHEIGMIGLYKTRSREFFKDSMLGIKMFLQGKIRLLPSLTRRRKEIRRIFAEAEKLSKKG